MNPHVQEFLYQCEEYGIKAEYDRPGWGIRVFGDQIYPPGEHGRKTWEALGPGGGVRMRSEDPFELLDKLLCANEQYYSSEADRLAKESREARKQNTLFSKNLRALRKALESSTR